ncbi:ATP synthase [Litoreibacter roseus]|uniref:ATP synthase n=2 Tax=Litoreibacter roseus TaxID=2601869 RepID=A0A6N6JDX7_9RHOB|nr:ATP synthase [Litoreibacter roseus]
MPITNFAPLMTRLQAEKRAIRFGKVLESDSNSMKISGLGPFARLGDMVCLKQSDTKEMMGEVIELAPDGIRVLAEDGTSGFAIGDEVSLVGGAQIAPDHSWLGRVIDPFARPLDHRPLLPGGKSTSVRGKPPAAADRARLGRRLETGIAAFNTFFPIVKGQRLGLFAGSGVGKSTLLSNLAKGVEADVVVLALIGERGRELREFIEDTLGSEGLSRAVVVAATSDQSAMMRRRVAWTAMAVAEHFRDEGHHVLFLADSVTRFAEAHREIAASAGEAASLRGFPPSTTQAITELCERAGPGCVGAGYITGVFSVLVAGSDMEEPVADIIRGVLDGHIVLDRRIAERGRFPAIDVLRSVSRSLPGAASDDENRLLLSARKLMGDFAEAEVMIQAGLYAAGSDPAIDDAIVARPKLETFLIQNQGELISTCFERLNLCIPDSEDLASLS